MHKTTYATTTTNLPYNNIYFLEKVMMKNLHQLHWVFSALGGSISFLLDSITHLTHIGASLVCYAFSKPTSDLVICFRSLPCLCGVWLYLNCLLAPMFLSSEQLLCDSFLGNVTEGRFHIFWFVIALDAFKKCMIVIVWNRVTIVHGLVASSWRTSSKMRSAQQLPWTVFVISR